MSKTLNHKPDQDCRKDKRKHPPKPENGTPKSSLDTMTPPTVTKPGCKTNGCQGKINKP